MLDPISYFLEDITISGDLRPRIAIDNNIGEGTVGSIINYFKIGLDAAEFDSSRELALQAKKQGLNLSELAANFRLHNFIKTSGAAEEDIESFITNINSGDVSPVVEYVNQLFSVSSEQSIPLDQAPNYIEKKLEEKKKIDDQIKEADATLQSKNVSIEAINEHLKLNEKLNEYNLSFHDIDKLLNVLVNAKENGFDAKKIVERLKKIKRLQNKEDKLKHHCEVLSEQVKKCNNVLPLAQKIRAMNIDISELLAFDTAINEIARQYGLPPSVAAFRLIRDIKDYNKIGGLKKELSRLCQQIFVVNGICANQNKAMMAMINLQSRGISQDRILQLNNFLENNGNHIGMKLS
jgi:post-segregation antitoxin (ccd killing protein)